MKNLLKLCVPVLCIFLISCDKEEDPILEPGIADIIFLEEQLQGESQELEVTLQKPTPCHTFEETIFTITDNIVDYDFIMLNGEEVCAQVLTNEKVTVEFEPSASGEYLLNFHINGKLYQTRTVTVAEE